MSNRNKGMDPFYEEPPTKAFYHPSPERLLGKKERQTHLGSDRIEIGGVQDKFMKKSNTYKTKLPTSEQDAVSPREDTTHFNESWPGSERPSTVSIPDLEQSPLSFDGHHKTGLSGDAWDPLRANLDNLPERDTDAESSFRELMGSKAITRENVQHASVLSKYMERFRQGVPMSREERQKLDRLDRRDFWWLSSSPPTGSSTPREDSNMNGTGKTRARTPKSTYSPYKKSPTKKDLDNGQFEPMSGAQKKRLNDYVDVQTRHLQDKADRLLERTESTMSSEPAVSTDGLGSSPSSNPSTYNEQPYRPAFTRYNPTAADNLPVGGERLFLEEDILQKWRMRRKMEQAREHIMQKCGGPGAVQKPTEVDSEVESKLAAFRRRLAGEVDLDISALRHTPNVSFTPAPETDPRPKPGCGSPQNPERAATSHSPIASPNLARRAEVRSSAADLDPYLHLSCDILPCPCQQHKHDSHHNEEIIRKLTGRSQTEQVSDKNKPANEESEEMERRVRDFDQTRPDNIDHGQVERRNGDMGQQSREVNHKLSHDKPYTKVVELAEETETDSSFELLKRKHMRVLQEEQRHLAARDSEHENEGQGHDNKKSINETRHGKVKDGIKGDQDHGGDNKGQRERSVRRVEDESSRSDRNDMPERDTSHKENQKLKNKHKTGKQVRYKSKHEGERNKASSKSQVDRVMSRTSDQLGDGKMPRSKTSSRRDGRKVFTEQEEPNVQSSARNRQKKVADEEETDGSTKSNKEGISESDGVVPSEEDSRNPVDVKMSQKQSKVSQKVSVNSTQKMKPKGKKLSSHAPTPTMHSSPKQPIHSAIGQIVSERLFPGSLIVTSSVESFDPSLHPTQQKEVTIPSVSSAAIGSLPQQPLELETVLYSDEDEFVEDEMLQDLRRRRNIYLKRLKEIENILQPTLKNETETSSG